MSEVVQSLFGINPTDILAQREAMAQRQAMQFAQMDPMQQSMYGAALAGNRIGGAVGGMLGAQDPELQRVAQRQKLASQIDWSNPESVGNAIMKASQMNDTQAALELTQRYQQMKTQGTELQLKRAQAMKAISDAEFAGWSNEMKNAHAMVSPIHPKGTPEYAKAFGETMKTLTQDKKAGIKEVGVTADGRLPVYQDPNTDQQFVYATGPDGKQIRKPYVGAVDRSTAKVSATANAGGSIQEDAFSKELGKQNAARLNDAMVTAQSSGLALQTLNAMEEKNNAGTLYSGPQANVHRETANFLESIGLLSNKEVGRLTDSTTFDKYAKDLVMQDLGGKLGAQISDADRKFVEARIPQLTTNPQARTELLAKLKEIHGRKVDYYQRMQKHAIEKKTLNDFDFANAPAASKAPLGSAQNPIKLTPKN